MELVITVAITCILFFDLVMAATVCPLVCCTL